MTDEWTSPHTLNHVRRSVDAYKTAAHSHRVTFAHRSRLLQSTQVLPFCQMRQLIDMA
jgi:hypothetical protein